MIFVLKVKLFFCYGLVPFFFFFFFYQKLAEIVAKTDKFSGADIAEICRAASRAAIKEHIMLVEQQRKRKAALAEEGDAPENSDEDEDEVQATIKPRHFVEAMRGARRSISDEDLRKYSHFADKLSQQRGVC